MKKIIVLAFTVCITASAFSEHNRYAATANGRYIFPHSTLQQAYGTEQTFNIIFKPSVQITPPSTCETPASLACIYSLTPNTPGCPRTTLTPISTAGAGKTIAIVDAYDYNDQAADLNTYTSSYGLPAPTLFIVGGGAGSNCTITDPVPSTQGWQDEHILDLDMVHAMAPYATIYMVEANSSDDADLMTAEDCATHLLTQAGGGIVSNSWGGPEAPGETADDVHFQNPGIVYLVSSGDYSAPPNYPSSSPYVVSAGGTTVLRNAQGNFIGETGWSTAFDSHIGEYVGSSGGPSAYELRPPNQLFVQKIVDTARGTPDISFDADPQTGVCVYSTFSSGWIQEGGTSVASPALSGILISSAYLGSSSQDLLNYIYGNISKGYHAYWNDQTTGNNGHSSLAGYDFVTGLGSPRGYDGK